MVLLVFQSVIDLKNNILHLGSTDTTTPFLHESEIPKFGQETPVPSPAGNFFKFSILCGSHVYLMVAAVAHNPAAEASHSAGAITAEHEEKIGQMVAMGFSREDSIRELIHSEWNVTIAIAKMFGKQSQ